MVWFKIKSFPILFYALSRDSWHETTQLLPQTHTLLHFNTAHLTFTTIIFLLTFFLHSDEDNSHWEEFTSSQDKLKGCWNLAGGTRIPWKPGSTPALRRKALEVLLSASGSNFKNLFFPGTHLGQLLNLGICAWRSLTEQSLILFTVIILSQPPKQGGLIQAARWERSLACADACCEPGNCLGWCKLLWATTQARGWPRSSACAHILMCFGLLAWMKLSRLITRLGKQDLLPGLSGGTSFLL